MPVKLRRGNGPISSGSMSEESVMLGDVVEWASWVMVG
jgi:hypothetical protein